MSKVLTTEQREQAGSDSYNRFEYQVHWIVYHIIGKLQDNTECIVFCEFHDDMAEFSTDNQQYQFYHGRQLLKMARSYRQKTLHYMKKSKTE